MPTTTPLPTTPIAAAHTYSSETFKSQQDWWRYAMDAMQRGVLWLDLLRQRGNIQAEMTDDPSKTVLQFEGELAFDGRTLPRPINYYLARILPPKGTPTDPRKRPFVVADPRAGQSPGIGGFKLQSEIGDALAQGHPTYLLGFCTVPAPGQTYEDIVIGQTAFFEWVRKTHSNALPPCAIGNCAAGYPTMMTASLSPDLFGPIVIAGSPVSYWNGERGKYPMRYSGGLLGGAWLAALTGDIGNGIFDGAWLVLNFDLLGPENFLWDKQYDVIADIDKGSKRYLDFERWWGDFCVMNKDELLYIVKHFFIGNELTAGQMRTSDGRAIDLRNIKSPIVILGSTADNISPPGQSVAWVADLYRDVEEMQALDKTFVYILSDHYGHLAQFVSSAVGEREDKAIISEMLGIDLLPPGLYELIVDDPKNHPPGTPLRTHFKARNFDDLRALGVNSPEDDRAFAAVARVSQGTLSLYERFLSPWVRAMSSPESARLLRDMHPLRLSYSLFSERSNPFMTAFAGWAEQVRQNRAPVNDDNPWLQWQKAFSDGISESLKAFGEQRDMFAENAFWQVWGNPWLQAACGISADAPARPVPPARTLETQQAIESYEHRLNKMFTTQKPETALLRGLALLLDVPGLGNQAGLDAILNVLGPFVKQWGWSLLESKTALREQFGLVGADRQRALATWAEFDADLDGVLKTLAPAAKSLDHLPPVEKHWAELQAARAASGKSAKQLADTRSTAKPRKASTKPAAKATVKATVAKAKTSNGTKPASRARKA